MSTKMCSASDFDIDASNIGVELRCQRRCVVPAITIPRRAILELSYDVSEDVQCQRLRYRGKQYWS
jgi:hypothetical protein